jgi:hypothetical protein
MGGHGWLRDVVACRGVRGLGIGCVDAIATDRRVRQAAIGNGLFGARFGYLVANTCVFGSGAVCVNMVD